MCSFFTTSALLLALLTVVNAQQTDSVESTEKKIKSEEQTATGKAAEANPKAAPSKPAEEQRTPAIKETPGDKEEQYDMTEVSPVITHSQISVDGKVHKYTATAGRLHAGRSLSHGRKPLFLAG